MIGRILKALVTVAESAESASVVQRVDRDDRKVVFALGSRKAWRIVQEYPGPILAVATIWILAALALLSVAVIVILRGPASS